MLSNLHSKASLEKLWTISMSPVMEYQGEELSTSLSTSQEAAECSKISPEPLFLQTRQAKGP